MSLSNYSTLSVDGKAVKVATLDGRVVYSALSDYGAVNMEEAEAAVKAAGVVFQGEYLSGTYVPPGDTEPYQYFFWDTYEVQPTATWRPKFVDQGPGDEHPFPIARVTNGGPGPLSSYGYNGAVFIRSASYGEPLSSFYFKGGSQPPELTSTQWMKTVVEYVDLSSWAPEHGFDLPPEAIGDIQLVLAKNRSGATAAYQVELTNLVAIPTRLQLQGLMQRDTLSGTAGWMYPQTGISTYLPELQPVVFEGHASNGELKWSTPQKLSTLVPGECSSLVEYPTYLGTDGDYGKPVVVKFGNKLAAVSHPRQVVKAEGDTAPYAMQGPDYAVAYPAIKAYCDSVNGQMASLSAVWDA